MCAANGSGNGKRTLSVHHIDGNPLNNAPENLRTLCQRCHIAIVHESPGRRPTLLPESELRQLLAVPRMSVAEIARRLGVTRRIAGYNIQQYGLTHHGQDVDRPGRGRRRRS